MTISLITDGMLNYYDYPVVSGPQDVEGEYGPLPHRPCSPEGVVEPAPPRTPMMMAATGDTYPHVPCGPTGVDPTIDPPKVPRGLEGSTPPSSGPATPKCPKGDAK